MVSQASAEIRYSGGAQNGASGASLGGVMSNYGLSAQSMTPLEPISGVFLVDSVGNATGAGTIGYTASTGVLSWFMSGGAVGLGIIPTIDGRYAIPGSGSEYLVVDVVLSALPTVDTAAEVTIGNLDSSLLPDTFEAVTDYHCFYVYCFEAVSNVTLKLRQPTQQDSLSFGLDPAGTNVTAQTLALATDVPVGVSFNSADIVVGNMVAGGRVALWIKRTTVEADIIKADLEVCGE